MISWALYGLWVGCSPPLFYMKVRYALNYVGKAPIFLGSICQKVICDIYGGHSSVGEINQESKKQWSIVFLFKL